MMKHITLLLIILIILTSCATQDEEIVNTPVSTPSSSSGIHEEDKVKDICGDCLFTYRLEDYDINNIEDEAFLIEYWLIPSRQFSDDFYLKDYDDTWIKELDDSLDQESYMHDINDEGIDIKIDDILNGLGDETILYNDLIQISCEGKPLYESDTWNNHIGIRYKKSYLKDVLGGDIKMGKVVSEPMYSLIYKAFIDHTRDDIYIRIDAYSDKSVIVIEYERMDHPIYHISYISDVVIE